MDSPDGYWGAVKEELSTVRDNLGLKPEPVLNPSNDVERAGAAMTEVGQTIAAIVSPLLTGGEGEEPQSGGTSGGKPGEVYVTEPQESGKPYVGRTTQGVDARMETRTDGRTGKATTVDTYKTTEEGRHKEQKAIDQRGGVENLDNKRNEVNQEKMQELKKKYDH